MALRDYLEERELDLLKELESVRSEIEALQTKLIPLEAELAEVRRAMSAVGMGGIGTGIGGIGGLGVFAPAVVPSGIGIGGISGVGIGNFRPSDPAALRDSTASTSHQMTSPYSALTMKQLVEKALSEHFHNGAPTRALLEFFQNAWNRKIERTSLSPQLSRLYREGVIGRIPSTKGWFLIQPERRIQGFRPYLHEGRIVWSQPETVSSNDQYEPLQTRDVDAGGRRPYRTTEKSYYADQLQQAGAVLWLLPNEVSHYHVPLEPAEWPDLGVLDDEED
jgi:hypothetical protein